VVDHLLPDAAYAVPPSRWVDIDGPVHYVEYGDPGTPALVCVHGLGGSLLNWAALAPLLAPTHRVIALDLAGFGRSRGHGRDTGVGANADLLEKFLTAVGARPATLIGNSMGGMISALQAVRRPGTVDGLVLVDPVLPVGPLSRLDPLVATVFAAYAVPPLGRVLRSRYQQVRTAEEAAQEMLRLCCGDPARVPPAVLRLHIELALERQRYPDADAEFLAAARSLLAILARRRRYAGTLAAVGVPVLLLHGDADRLVPVRAARVAAASNPSWRFEVAAGAGHIPQLEVPDWVAAQVLDWRAGLAGRSGAGQIDLVGESGAPQRP
jgi:pimeloyl-ACP methyl ester carboxylesterase